MRKEYAQCPSKDFDIDDHEFLMIISISEFINLIRIFDSYLSFSWYWEEETMIVIGIRIGSLYPWEISYGLRAKAQ